SWTSGIALLVGSVLGIGSYATYPLPSMAQGTEARTGRCVPAIATGRVRCDYDSGDSYIGQVVNGLPSGTGVYVYSNGDRYEGQFRLGKPNGRGQFIFKDDARVEGIFRDGKVSSGTAIFT
ncbi:MORN motif-containing protein, partial [Microcoleus sp. HI-ES]|nr:MORN motif-containing protein [Microcoleus sp. HI-ES]